MEHSLYPELLLIVGSAGLGVLSLRRAPNLGTSWCFTVFVPIPASGTIDNNLGPVPLFSHPHGICRHQTTTEGDHHGAGRGVDWSSDPDGTIIFVTRAFRFWPGSQERSMGLRRRQCFSV